MPTRAARVVRTDVPAGFEVRRSFGRLWRVLRGAAVVLDEAIAYRRRQAHRTRVVFETHHLPQRDRVVAAVAAAELRAFVNRRAAKDLRAGARDFVAHAAAVAEAVRE